MLGIPIKSAVGGVLVTAFVVAAVVSVFVLMVSQPPDYLGAPTPLCRAEIEAIGAFFLVSVAVLQPAKDSLEGRAPSLSRMLRLKVEVPKPIRVVALAMLLAGSFFLAVIATADVLGGYNGYGYSFSTHPFLPLVYNNTIGLLPYFSSRDKGTQSSFFFILAFLGLVMFRLDRGIGNALKDAMTLFAAPFLVVFELALWHYAPEDMSWHVTDYLSMGGTADGGYRALDTGGAYIVSNWLVLFVSLLMVASRIPWVSMPSRIFWQRKGPDSGMVIGASDLRGDSTEPLSGPLDFPTVPAGRPGTLTGE